MILTLLTLVHIVICIFLIIVVLLQSGKAADLAGAFGGMGSQTAFGPRGSATLLSKATTIAAGLFMVTSLTLAILATRNTSVGSSVLERQAPAKAGQTSPLPAGQAPKPGSPAGSVTMGGGGQGQTTIPLQIPQPGTAPAKPGAPAQQQPAAPPKK